MNNNAKQKNPPTGLFAKARVVVGIIVGLALLVAVLAMVERPPNPESSPASIAQSAPRPSPIHPAVVQHTDEITTLTTEDAGGPEADAGVDKIDAEGIKKQVAKVQSSRSPIKGSLSKEVIRKTVHKNIPEVKFCIERQLRKRSAINQLTLKFVISGRGKVQHVQAISRDQLLDKETENCILESVKRWNFPPPKGGGIVVVTYPMHWDGPEG